MGTYSTWVRTTQSISALITSPAHRPPHSRWDGDIFPEMDRRNIFPRNSSNDSVHITDAQLALEQLRIERERRAGYMMRAYFPDEGLYRREL